MTTRDEVHKLYKDFMNLGDRFSISLNGITFQ